MTLPHLRGSQDTTVTEVQLRTALRGLDLRGLWAINHAGRRISSALGQLSLSPGWQHHGLGYEDPCSARRPQGGGSAASDWRRSAALPPAAASRPSAATELINLREP